MTRIFFYELKRLLWNQFFVGILTVILFTGWQILNQVTLLGIEQTAPFSVQSFCDYLLRLLPLFMDWLPVLSVIFLFKIGTENSRNHPCYTRKSTGLRSYSMQCSLYRLTPSDRCCIPSGCCILWKIFSLVSLGDFVAPWLPDSNPDGTD